jgi:hypothetical protein
MQSKALRDAEKQLKELLIYSGNRDVWDEMMDERVRMYKERARLEQEKKRAKAQAEADLIDRALIFISFTAIIIPVFAFSFHMLTN